MTAFTGTFDESEVGSVILVRPGQSFVASLSVASGEEGIGTVQFERSLNGGQTWKVVRTATGAPMVYRGIADAEADTELTGTVASESLINEYHDVARYRWNCVDFDKTNSDDILWSIETGQVYEFDPTQNEVRAALRGAVAQVGWTIGAEADNARAIGIQLKDADGQDTIGVKAVTMGVFADANGNAFATTGGSTGIAIGTDGALLALVAKKLFVLTSEADGDIDLTWTDTATEAVYLGVFLPNGSIAMSPKIQNAA